MGILYAEGGKIYCNDYMEIYIPLSYFESGSNVAVNMGSFIQTLGLVYTRAYPGGKEGPIRFMNIPVVINLMAYEFRNDTIKVHNQKIDVLALQYLKGSYVLHQTIPKGRIVAEEFLTSVLNGKLPHSLNYKQILNLWWRNLEISGVNFKVPSKIYEMIIAAMYRNPNNNKERYGQWYGKQANPTGYEYKTGNVRSVVKDLSTFSGMVFEDMGEMITNGINNSLDGVKEPESPLEKIIHY